MARASATVEGSATEGPEATSVGWPPMVSRVLSIVATPRSLRDVLKQAARGGATSAGDVLRAVEILLAARLVAFR